MSAKENLKKAIRERIIFLEKVNLAIEKREERKNKLKAKNMFISDAEPKYKESYTGNR